VKGNQPQRGCGPFPASEFATSLGLIVVWFIIPIRLAAPRASRICRNMHSGCGRGGIERMMRHLPRRATRSQKCMLRRMREARGGSAPTKAAAGSQHYPQVGAPISIPTRLRRRRVAQASSLWGQRASRPLGRGLSSGDWPADGTPGRMPGVPTGSKPVLLVRDATPSGNPPRRLVGNAQSRLPQSKGWRHARAVLPHPLLITSTCGWDHSFRDGFRSPSSPATGLLRGVATPARTMRKHPSTMCRPRLRFVRAR